MTALVACLGFVRMSTATIMGAEVQKTACHLVLAAAERAAEYFHAMSILRGSKSVAPPRASLAAGNLKQVTEEHQ
jgi:hypothetical protein